ncbi:MAG: SIMPL domain-containing protein [Acidimicrobiia bacterium]
MRKHIIVAVLAAGTLLMAACTPSVTVENSGSPGDGLTHGISVSGVGRVTGTPDTLTMSFGVQVVDDSVSVAVDRAADRADAVIDALIASGVAEADIQTANYSVYPRYEWRNDQQILTGYEVSNTVTAKIREIGTAGGTIDAVTAAGGDDVTVSGVSFSIEDNEALLEAAREAAWTDARAKAEQLASLSGVTLGAPSAISESFSSAQPPIWYDVRAEASDGGAVTPITPGEQEVAVTLQVQFSIDD